MRGEAGAKGDAGANGANGANGAAGADGPQGNPGNRGAAGTQGPQGVRGEAGAKGDAGANGANGANGAAGADGPQGNPGASGANGGKGATGPQGNAGDDGAGGERGAAGAAGPQGSPGSNGADGERGATGPVGATGNVGPPDPTLVVRVQGLESDPRLAQALSDLSGALERIAAVEALIVQYHGTTSTTTTTGTVTTATATTITETHSSTTLTSTTVSETSTTETSSTITATTSTATQSSTTTSATSTTTVSTTTTSTTTLTFAPFVATVPANETIAFKVAKAQSELAEVRDKVNVIILDNSMLPSTALVQDVVSVEAIANTANKKSNASMVLIFLVLVFLGVVLVSLCRAESTRMCMATDGVASTDLEVEATVVSYSTEGGGQRLVPNVLYSSGAVGSASTNTSTGGGASISTSTPAWLVPNVLYNSRAVGSASTNTSTDGGASISTSSPASASLPAAVAGKDHDAAIDIVYAVPIEGADAHTPAFHIVPTAAAGEIDAHARAPVAVALSAPAPLPAQRAQHINDRSTAHGYVNTSFEVMKAMLSTLPAMSRPDAESALAAANVDGGFLLRQKHDSSTKVVVSCTTKGAHEHYIMELVEDANQKGAQWLYRSKALPGISMNESAITLLKDQLVHSSPTLLFQGRRNAQAETKV